NHLRYSIGPDDCTALRRYPGCRAPRPKANNFAPPLQSYRHTPQPQLPSGVMGNIAAVVLDGAGAYPSARFPVLDPPDFLILDPPSLSFRRCRQSGCLRVFLLRRKLAGSDPAVAFPGDVDGEGRVLEAVTDSIGDDGITDHLDPVIDRQLRGKHRGFVDRALLKELAEVLRLGSRQLSHPEVVQDDHIGLGHLVAELQVRAGGSRE